MKIKGSGKKFRAISHESDTVLLERRKGHGVRVKGWLESWLSLQVVLSE